MTQTVPRALKRDSRGCVRSGVYGQKIGGENDLFE